MSTQPAVRTLLVDDDKNIRQTLAAGLRMLGCEVTLASSGEEAISQLKSADFDFVLTDFRMERKSGLDVVRAAKAISPEPCTVVMTAFASYDNAVLAIKEGAYDYLAKPFSNAQLGHLVQKVRTLIGLRSENRALKKAIAPDAYFEGMTSPAMARLESFVSRVAGTEATVLMVGESGTGKTELARALHQRSPRRDRPFVVVNCVSLAESLLESELFGHVKGAFTGATQDRVGKIESADRGTVFLDEIGDLSEAGQAKLLRFLQEKVIERVGSNKVVSVDVRVIAATNKDLEEAVRAGRFREDLYYRLNVFECALVPLRHRSEDLPVLIERFVLAKAADRSPKSLPEDVRRALLAYSWPGNVRELRNVIERLVLLAAGGDLSFEDLPEALKCPAVNALRDGGPDRLISLEELERAHIERVLALERNQEKAAQILGITSVTLWRKRKQYGLP